MKISKTFYIVLLLAILVSAGFMVPTQAQDRGFDYQIFFPMVFKHTTQRFSFGMELRQFNHSRLNQVVEAGNDWLRVNGLLWSSVQPNSKNDWAWDNVAGLENDLRAARAANQEVMLIIRSTPRWAQQYDGVFCGPIKQGNFGDFANFMSAVVTRYSGPEFGVKYYEIWNEPDDNMEKVNPTYPHGCWGNPNLPDFGGRYYGEMLKQVYPAVKGANSQAQLVVGGLLMPCDPIQHWYSDHCPMSYFLRGILHVGAGSAFDILNIHAYAHYHPGRSNMIQMERTAINWWSDRGGEVEGKFKFINEIMNQYGVSKRIIITESGMLDYGNTHVDGSNPASVEAFEQTKADYVVWLFVRNMAWGVEATNIYNDYIWNRTGLFNQAGERLPAFFAFDTLTTALDGAFFQRNLSLGAGVIGFEFSRADRRVWVLFSEDGAQKSISTPAGFLRAYDQFGNSRNPSGGRIYFTRPIYVELSP